MKGSDEKGNSAAPDLSFVDEAVAKHGAGAGELIPILQEIQAHYRYLPEPALRRLCEITGVTPAALAGVSSFYAQFRHRPMGRHHIKVCDGTACHINGADEVHDALCGRLGLAPGEDTDVAGDFTVEKVFCVGCCTLAPVVVINEDSHGGLSRETAPKLVDDFIKREKKERRKRRRAAPEQPPTSADAPEIRICVDSCCVARGTGKTHDALLREVSSGRLNARIKTVGCVIMCDRTPFVEIVAADGSARWHSGVGSGEAVRLLRGFNPRGLLPRLRRMGADALDWLTAANREPPAGSAPELPGPAVAAFFGRQKHIATEHFGRLDPLDLKEYFAHDGFAGFRRAVAEMKPSDVLDVIEKSGLRGRGGAGFPTARKWRVTAAAGDDGDKYVICNGDEGDPGAFMDRMLMESFPYRIIEGMMIAARAVGADKGFIYVRAEYPHAVRRLREALVRCRGRGLLGPGGFDLKLFEGAGAFVCGEETAMLESMEGRRGVPRLKPPYPAEEGYRGRPTLINNVETFANVPWILRNGPEAYGSIGSPASKGAKVFALAGKVKRGGLIEVPMGITIREVVEEIGGGTPDGAPFKAVLIGGPSGGCVPAELADTPIDYESLSKVGAIMGSGGLIVLGQGDCMVSLARYFLGFCQCESCGKCTFCRVGTRRLLDILDRLCTGKGKKGDLEELELLSDKVRRASLCGLGKTAPNPVLSALRYFRGEFEAHIDGRCPAGKCKDLISYHVTDACVGCTLCTQVCPADAIPYTPYRRHVILTDPCTRCDACRQICPENAIVIK